MTAIAFVVVDGRGRAAGTYSREANAERMAEQIGARVETREIVEGNRVRFTFHGHPRTGVVVRAEGTFVTVRFVQGTTGPVEKVISVEKIDF